MLGKRPFVGRADEMDKYLDEEAKRKKEKERRTILNRTRLLRWIRLLRFDLPASRRRLHQLNRTLLSYPQLRLSQQLQLSPHPQSNLFVRPVRKHPLLPP